MATTSTKVVQIGNSLGVILPKAMLERLNIEKGDQVNLSDCEAGVMMSAYDEEVAKDLKLAREIAKRYRNTLRELAK